MLVSITLKNYRSLKEAYFSMEAESSKSKESNFFIIEKNKKKTKLLNSSVVYGANASGKSNLFKGSVK